MRFAAHTAAIRVKHLHPFVSNELLAESFSLFGEIERAIVCIDEKGKPNGEGIVEFARKPGASQALKRVNEGIFLLGRSVTHKAGPSPKVARKWIGFKNEFTPHWIRLGLRVFIFKMLKPKL